MNIPLIGIAVARGGCVAGYDPFLAGHKRREMRPGYPASRYLNEYPARSERVSRPKLPSSHLLGYPCGKDYKF